MHHPATHSLPHGGMGKRRVKERRLVDRDKDSLPGATFALPIKVNKIVCKTKVAMQRLSLEPARRGQKMCNRTDKYSEERQNEK